MGRGLHLLLGGAAPHGLTPFTVWHTLPRVDEVAVTQAAERLADLLEPRHLLALADWLGGENVNGGRVESPPTSGLSNPHTDQAA